MSTNAFIYICYARADRAQVSEIAALLEKQGFRVWMDRDQLPAGEDWRGMTQEAITAAGVFLLILSPASLESGYVHREVEMADRQGKTIVPVVLDGRQPLVLPDALSFMLDHIYQVPWSVDRGEELLKILNNLQGTVLPESSGPVKATASVAVPAKGYVFISYSNQDHDFVERFKVILKRRNYGYWDYSESQRDYHNALYKELEQKIEEAAAFVCIVSDHWRESDWPAAEYLYAREAKVPVFVLQAKPLKRPIPIILIQQTRIDFSQDFDRAAAVLEHELDRKNL